MKSSSTKASKITINTWRPVWSKLEKQLEDACLKRDAYIGSLIDCELEHLEDEMPIANSEAAQKFIDKQLRALLDQNSTPLSIALRPQTAANLERVCSAKRIVRDSFFNRLLLFLAFGPHMAGLLLFKGLWLDYEKGKPGDWTREVWTQYKHDGPFFENVFEPFTATRNPLWSIRACFELIEERDKPEYVDWTNPETNQTIKMAKWVPDHLLCLPYRFYTAVLTDHDLAKKSPAPARPAAQGVTKAPSAEHAYHNLYGLNCYLPNFHVRGHPEQLAAQEAVDDLLAEL
jgi:hypothetical protein